MAQDAAEKSAKEAESLKTRITWTGILAIVSLLVSISFGLYQVASLVQASNEYLRNSRAELAKRNQEIDDRFREIATKLDAVEKKSTLQTPVSIPVPPVANKK